MYEIQNIKADEKAIPDFASLAGIDIIIRDNKLFVQTKLERLLILGFIQGFTTGAEYILKSFETSFRH